MKFTDGFWTIREGVKPFFPVNAHDIEETPRSLTVYAATRHLANRFDALDGPIITIEFSSPMPDVIRVKLIHFAGEQPRLPFFDVVENPETTVLVSRDEKSAILTSGKLSASVSLGNDWRVDFRANDSLVTSSEKHGMGFAEMGGETYAHEQLSLGVGEYVYGLGERFTAFIKNGQVVDTWNEDGGTNSQLAYKNIPFYMTNRGYGVFVNHPGNVSFEVGSEKVTRVQFSVPGQSLEYFVIYGPTPKEVLEKYTALTGRPALPPPWSFGLWLSTSFTTSYDEDTVTSFIQGMADRRIPLSVFHFDCFWMKEFNWCDFEWDKRMFRDPAAMLKRLKERGLHICLWINPYIAQRSSMFAEGMQNGYLLKKPNGGVWQWDRWQPGMGIVDFTNPAACQWYGDKLRALLEMGADCFKSDFGERIPTGVVYSNGADPEKMHNYFTYLYNQTVFETIRQQRGNGEALVFARSATTGGQKFPVHWGGDCESTFESMAESLRGGLSLSLSGFGFWSHDIGGFSGTPPADVYKRWIAFGLLSSHSRLHGNSSYRVPWLFDEEAVDVLRAFTRLKCRLMPYLYAGALEANRKGTPMMRAMLLEFPDDPTCDYLDRQYMLGPSLLVAPVFSHNGEVTYYLPAGRWTNFFTGEVVDGARWKKATHGFMSLPLFVRPNSVIPVGEHDDRPDYDYGDGVNLHVYELEDGKTASTVIPNLTGEVAAIFAVQRQGRLITVKCQGTVKRWQVLLVGIQGVESVDGGKVENNSRGALVSPGDGDILVIRLAE
jgi:alpha-D-xyloside xylohydrolase